MVHYVKLDKKYFKDIYKFHKILIKKFGQINIFGVYVSKEDIKLLRKSIIQKVKEENPYASSKQIKITVAWSALNLEPNSVLANVIKPGYVIVITR